MNLSKLEDKDFYILKFERDQYNIEEMCEMYENLKKVFGDKLICIPNDMDLSSEDKEILIKYIKEH